MDTTSDTTTIDALVAALYASMSFLPGAAPDHARLRALFVPGGRLVPPGDDGVVVPPLDLDQFIDASQRAIEASETLPDKGLVESEVARTVQRFAAIAHVFSTYETRHTLDEVEPLGRGINSLQLTLQAGRWWIISMSWDDESPQTPIAAKHLIR